MVHAEASTFTSGLSKDEVYTQALEQAASLFENQRNWVCNLSNASSLLYHALKSLPPPSNAVNWCGFYVADPTTPSQLILGPFQGHVACQTIAFGKGVCGTAATKKETQIVPDVDKFPGHIACDSASKSEIVVPIIQTKVGEVEEKVVAIIDIDCAETEGFGECDREWLEKFALLIANCCDFQPQTWESDVLDSLKKL